MELPGDLATDLAAVWIYKEVPHDEVPDHAAKGWERVASYAISTVTMRIKAEEYF